MARAGPSNEAKEAVAGRVDLGTSEALEEGAHARVMSLDEVTPTRVAELGELLGRADDVREEHRREHALEFCFLTPDLAEECVDRPQHCCLVPDP